MKNLVACIEELRASLERHKKANLKEYPTRTIFVDPLLEALGWDVRDPDEVQLEYPTIDGKSVDYAPKINRKPVLFIEAKPLNDPLNDVKAITQVVGYAANAGVEWCILTNGVTYKVYKSSEVAEAPEKLLYQVSIDPKDSNGQSVQEIAKQFQRFSREAMAEGVLDEIGERIFTTGKVRKALDKLFLDPPDSFIRSIRTKMDDDNIKPRQIKDALKRIWGQSSDVGIKTQEISPEREKGEEKATRKRGSDTGERHHIEGKPQEVLELYRSLDKFCFELDPSAVNRKFLKKYIGYRRDKSTFCSVHLRKSGLRIWVKLNYPELEDPPEFVRDVSNVGHWGVGDVEVSVDNMEQLELAKKFIRKSFEENK